MASSIVIIIAVVLGLLLVLVKIARCVVGQPSHGARWGSPMSDHVRTVEQFFLVAIFPICSLAGLAALLRRGDKPTRLEVASSLLNSGLFGVAVASYLLHQYTIQSWQLILCGSILSGLGGNVLLTFTLAVLQRLIVRMAETVKPSGHADIDIDTDIEGKK